MSLEQGAGLRARIDLTHKSPGASTRYGNLALALYDPDGQLLESVTADADTKEVKALNVPRAGRYAVRVFPSPDPVKDRNSYALTIDVEPPTPPAAPSNLSVTATSSDRLFLIWTDNATNESGFKIERKLSGEGAFTELATVPENTTTYTSVGLSEDTTATYRVRAYNTAGTSAYTPEASGTTLLTTPGALTATAVGDRRVDLAWQDQSGRESGYEVQRSPDGTTFTTLTTTAANVTGYIDASVVEATTYTYRVRAVKKDAGGTLLNRSDYTSPATVTTPLAAPSDLTAMAQSQSAITLAWTDNSTKEDGLTLERKTTGAFAQLATLPANTTTYTDTGLAVNTLYTYRVKATTTAGGASASSNEASATTWPPPPAAPTTLTAQATSPTTIALTWEDQSTTETSFRLERRKGSETTFSLLASVGANTTSYTDTTLTEGTTATYRVRAENAGGVSAYSNEASATTPIPPPAAPTSLTATVLSQTAVRLTWQDQSTNETSFRLERKLGSETAFSLLATVGANVTTYPDASLSASTTATYRVRAENAGGTSAFSNEVTVTTWPPPPAAPTALTATAQSQTVVALTWQDTSDTETGFEVERKTTGAFAQVATVSANTTSYSDTGLVANTAYVYRVKATNAGGASASSNEASATTWPNPPTVPTALTATARSQTEITLTWQDTSDTETGFFLERKKAPEAAFTLLTTLGANVTTYTDATLTAATTATYRVRAVNTGGASPYSNEATATTWPNPPSAPTTLTATARSQTEVTLTWTDQSTNETSFRLERQQGSETAFSLLATVGANVTSYTDATLTASTTATYRVRAENTGGASTFSNEATVTTLPNPPTAPTTLTATARSQTDITLTWQDTSDNETGFALERRMATETTWTTFTLPANTTTSTDAGLVANTTYIYRVKATNAGGASAYSNEASATTWPNPPSAPTTLTATPTSQTEVQLTWQDTSDNETGFALERRLSTEPGFTKRANLPANTTSYSDTGLVANTTYVYRLQAINTGGASAYSNEVRAKTLAPPVGNDDRYSTPEDTPLTVAAPGVLGNDVDADGETLSATKRTDPTQGTVTVSPTGAVTYTPRSDVHGTDTFTYQVSDGRYTSPPVTVTITVTPVNDAPTAANDSYTTAEDTTLTVAAPTGLLANDADVDHDPLQAVLVAGPSQGTLTLNPTGSFTYTPRANVHGPDRFTYKVLDSSGAPSSVATVTLTITPVNDVPVATDQAVTTSEDTPRPITLTATDVDGDPLTYRIVSGPTHGTLSGTPPTLTYTPTLNYSGADRFTFAVHDGTAESLPATVTLTITPVADPPAPPVVTATALPGAQVQLTWTTGGSGDPPDRVVVERQKPQKRKASPFVTIATLPGETTSYTDRPGVGTFVYRLRATNAGGEVLSNTVTVKTKKGKPPQPAGKRQPLNPSPDDEEETE